MSKQSSPRRNSPRPYLIKRQFKRTPRPNPRRNLRLVMLESALTHGSISVAIMTPFFISIGLNQAEIATTQALFTAVVMLLNFPTGWLADRFSRKWANVLGDLGCAISYLCYSPRPKPSRLSTCSALPREV